MDNIIIKAWKHNIKMIRFLSIPSKDTTLFYILYLP